MCSNIAEVTMYYTQVTLTQANLKKQLEGRYQIRDGLFTELDKLMLQTLKQYVIQIHVCLHKVKMFCYPEAFKFSTAATRYVATLLFYLLMKAYEFSCVIPYNIMKMGMYS